MRKYLLFLLMCLPCPAATITYVQGATNSTSTSAAVATMGSSVGLGDLLILFSKTAASSTPSINVTNAGTASCGWSTITTNFIGSQAGYNESFCIVGTAGTLAATATWTGGSGAHTDIAIAEYNSSTGWVHEFTAGTVGFSNTAATSCNTPGTGLVPANFLVVAVCGTFNASQTWAGTVGAYTNRSTASLSTTGFYDSITAAPAAQSFTTTISSDIYLAVLITFAPNGTYARGQPVMF